MLGMLQGSVWWAAKHGKEVESDGPADQQLQLLFFGESSYQHSVQLTLQVRAYSLVGESGQKDHTSVHNSTLFWNYHSE